jgi:integrase
MASSRGQILERNYGFLVRVFVGRDPATGKQVYENEQVRSSKKKDAEKVLTTVLRKLDSGELLLEPSTQTVEAYCEDWLETIAQPRLAKSTFKNYCHYLRKQVYPAFGKRKLIKIAPKDVQRLYGEQLGRGLSGRSVRYTHTVLSSALEHAVAQRLIPSNPCKYTQLPRLDTKEMNAMSEPERTAFLEASTSNRMHTYFALLLATGLRPAEGLALKWSDFDPVGKTLRIVRTLEYISGKAYFKEPKTKRSRRTISLHDGTVALLLEHRHPGALPGDLMFANLSGQPLNTSNVLNRYFKPCLLAAGLATLESNARGKRRITSKFRMYDLRHTHATILLEANVNPKIVSERLGHASVSLTLDTYSHILPTIQNAAVEALGASLYKTSGQPAPPPLN